MLLAGQVAIVTGSGRGIGRAIARRFASEGAAVLVTARTETEIRAVAADIQSSGGRATAVTADLAQTEDCQKIVAAARAAFGAVHILVNNGAIYGPVQPAEQFSVRDWDEVMAVNLRAPLLLAQQVLAEMYERQAGAILNIATVGAKLAFGLSAAYTASKAGLIGLTRVLAAEGARKGVRVNALCPGPVTETRMSKDLTRQFSAYFQSGTDETLKQLIDGVLQGRPQTAEEIASAALFLVCDQSRAVTGQTLNVDGGMVFY